MPEERLLPLIESFATDLKHLTIFRSVFTVAKSGES